MFLKLNLKVGISIMNSLIEVINFSKQYRNHIVKIGDITITKRVNLLVGKNGSGKSTLLKAIANVIKYDGKIIYNKKTSFMSEKVVYPLDLDINNFLINLNNISSSPVNSEKINKLLCDFDLLDKKKEFLHNLSKGMKAKVNLVQCLMEQADIYLIDEPLSGLDTDGVKQLIKYVEKSSFSFLISTHLIDEYSSISEEIFYL